MAHNISQYGAAAWLNEALRNVNYTPAASTYMGLLTASSWAASNAYSAGSYVIPTTANGRIYKCTTAGTSGSTAPAWPTTDGGTVADGTAVWTEQSIAMSAGTVPEYSGNGYAREAATFAAAAASGKGENCASSAAISFPVPTAAWPQMVGWGLWDASTAGNLLWWSCEDVNGNPIQSTPGTLQVTIGSGSLVVSLGL